MGWGLINEHTAKILLAAESGDSINQVSKKAGVSYSYTYEWIEKLEDAEIIERTGDGVEVVDEEVVTRFRGLAQSVLSGRLDLESAYLLPNFSGLEYRFTRTDAAYIWTKGGYQIARSQEDYPIFIDVHESDIEEWKRFFEDYGVRYSVEDRFTEGSPGIYYVVFTRSTGFRWEWVENSRVQPLNEAVEWMQGFEANFQPALEMLDEMYSLDL